ncbi:MAG: bifunctional hydroxymethylpyrimidine kinase/phosphomethylpyrimidine kinase [Bacteroidetes bacterium]|nr:bifunctional hydroxymethylpyrimidine kinase/phosphomethylpyrimidine kinase [Bacteroidota bacterium]
MSLVAVGTVAFDDIETPFGRAEKVVGGACTYISLAASYFVKPVQVVSVVGDDFPEAVLAFLQERGIDLSGLQIKLGEKSFFWAGRYHRDLNSRDTLDTQLNVLANFEPVLPESYKAPDVLMLGNLVPKIQSDVLAQLKQRPGLVVLDTMNFWMDHALDDLKAVLKSIDVLTINDEEARQLSGKHSLVVAAQSIHEMGPKYIVIKKGEHGALLFHHGQMFYAPALPLAEVIDPTGAGDSFAGGFTGYLAKTKDYSFDNLKRAVVYGAAMGSFCVEAFGIENLKQLTPSMIEARVQSFANLVHF